MAGKRELIEAVMARIEGLSRKRAEEIVDALIEALRETLSRDERVTIRGFGSFSVRERKARRGRNPATGETITVPARRMVRFRDRGGERFHEPPMDRPRRFEDDDFEEALDDDAAFGEAPPPPRRSTTPEEDPYQVMEVFYATDRKPTGSPEPGSTYGAGRGDGLRYGTCEVSIPRDHRIGQLESPSWKRLELRADPEKHVVLLDVSEAPRDAFFRDLAARVDGSERSELLVFVHGFNVTFEDAARRTAQIAYDLEFPGVPGFYSWPSRGQPSPRGYTHDENNVEWTTPHLVSFLEELSADSGAEAIHLVAHSMGNRALTRALEDLAPQIAAGTTRFREVILTAPDIDADVFRQLAARFRPTATRVTLYGSERDRALQLSHGIHGYPRAGDGGPDIVVVPDVETIDASSVETDFLGHSYYGSNRSVISDIYYLIRGRGIDDRFGLEERATPTGKYWIFAP